MTFRELVRPDSHALRVPLCHNTCFPGPIEWFWASLSVANGNFQLDLEINVVTERVSKISLSRLLTHSPTVNCILFYGMTGDQIDRRGAPVPRGAGSSNIVRPHPLEAVRPAA